EFVACPNWHVRPGLHFLLLEKLRINPGEFCIGMERAFDSIKHATDTEGSGRSSCIISSSFGIFDHADCPLGQITCINELHRTLRISWRQHLTPTINSHWPVGEAISLVMRPHDQSRANDQRPAGESFLRFLLGEGFER